MSEGTERTKRYPWRVPTPVEEMEPAPAMVTRYDLILVEFGRDHEHWTIKKRSKHYSAY